MKRDINPEPEDRGVLRFLTCGSVDDGKSTLIGRLLYDTKTLLTDTLATLERHAQKRGLSAVDLSLLTDGLTAEREQGITIDVAYRYFTTAKRKFIIADAPGHEQYTRNMVTAASTADLAILLVDARKGILPQTKRHATLAALVGVRQLILAVNKMDLVEFSQARFDAICLDFQTWLAQQQNVQVNVQYLPLSALEGDMVVDRGERLPWYRGATLIDLLQAASAVQLNSEAALRFPVQWVCRPSQSDFRGYAGRVEAGCLRVGDEVLVLPSGQRSRVTQISLGAAQLSMALAGQSVMVALADDIDISRGDAFVSANSTEQAPQLQQNFEAIVCWLSAHELSTTRNYVLKHTAREVNAKITSTQARLDIHQLQWQDDHTRVAMNDIVRIQLKTQQALVADAYVKNRSTGSFILIDPVTNNTVAAGFIQ